mmetsp:Transcript_32783/g.57050  ORF Transcript_32783/g.57050 Transcript_32783/m.57050 type:complete len:318 (+) Transcript_32783:2299-3252(+)
MKAFTFLLLAFSCCYAYIDRPPPTNPRPVIGVLSLPYRQTGQPDKDYIPFTYVRFVESGGARVVPLRVSMPDATLEQLFWSLNGVLFIGGDEPFFNDDGSYSRYAQVGCRFVELAKQAKTKGIYYPIWGTCLGHELIHICENNGSSSTLSDVKGEPPYIQRHDFHQEAYTSKMFGGFGAMYAMSILHNEKASWFNHHFAVEPKTYQASNSLSSSFVILATAKDREGTEYVSFAESKDYPIYTTQAHPERNTWEFSTSNEIPHSSGAVYSTNYLAHFFVDEARRNTNAFPSEDALKPWLIYNVCPNYLAGFSTEVYIF